jgi:Xaa-Pro aminopeptidase
MPAHTPPAPDHAARQRTLRRRLRAPGKAGKVDALLVTDPIDIRYLTGFVGEDSWLLVPIRGGSPIVLSDARFEEQIAREAPGLKMSIRDQPMADELADVLKRRKSITTLGVQPAHMTLATRKSLVKKLGASRVKPVADGLLKQRAVKDAAEIDAIRRAVRLTEQAMQATLQWLAPGKSEREVAAYLEHRMRDLGADGRSFATIAAVDANGSLPHYIPADKKLGKRSSLLIDWGAKWGGYCGDLTRVVHLAKPGRTMGDVYDLVLRAQEAAIAAIRPGVKCTEVDAVARDIIDDAGHAEHFGHGLGHGLGLEVHEQPVLSKRAGKKDVLEPGHVVTVEPGVYLPGVGGVRIEDDVLVTDDGHEVLSRLPKSRDWAMLGG